MKGTYIHSLLGSLKKYHISVGLLSTVIVLSIVMKVIGSVFNIKNHLIHPQFTEVSNKTWFLENADTTHELLYKLFFIVDVVWAPLLLVMLYKFIKWKTDTILTSLRWLSKVFAVLALVSLALDYNENFHYLTQYEYPKITTYKNLAYGITFLVFIVVALFNFKKSWLIIPLQFMKSSWISLLILFILGLALPKVPQFNSIIVDLYYRPLQFVILFLGVFSPLYAIVLSHYPSYLSLSKHKYLPEKEWRISERLWFFGTIWYKEKPLTDDIEYKNYKAYQNIMGYLRRVLGIFFYTAVFFLLAYTADTNFNCAFKFAPLTIVLILFLMLFLSYHKTKYSTWRITNNPYLKTTLGHESSDIYLMQTKNKLPSPDASLYDIHKPVRAFILWLCLSIVFLVVLLVSLYVSKEAPYTLLNVGISLACVISQAISYVYYRTYRTAFKYVFFDSKQKPIFFAFNIIDYTESKYQEHKSMIDNFFSTHDFKNGSKLLNLFSKFRFFKFSLGSLSNHIVFLQRIIYLGLVNSLILIGLNYFNLYAVALNSTLIILSYFFLFYGIIIILIKHFTYYSKSDEKFAKDNKTKFMNTIIVSVLAVLILNGLARFNSDTKSELYVLGQIERTPASEIDLETYVTNLKPGNRFYIGCYGGGMKANAWTMTVLDTLSKEFNIMEKATCMSGASGGTIGLINYATLYNQNDAENMRTAIVRSIATEDILSIDLTHFFGRDLVGHLLIPEVIADLKGKDRSTAAMKKYATHTNYLPNNSFDSLSYREYWKEMYLNKDKQFPILIANSTNIKGRQGMAVSVKSNGLSNDLLYAGADDILELDYLKTQNTLSYYNAVSTTNRFPLISPAATIKGKGQYNDGGIYENSGLLSAYKLYEAINEINDSISSKNVFVTIINDKNLFIKSYVKDNYNNDDLQACFGSDINESNEMQAILNSVAATEMLPSYIKEKLEHLSTQDIDNIKFINIYLPHQFDLYDIKSLYKPEIVKTMCVDKLDRMILKNQQEIIKALDITKKCEPIIEPELSRVMAKPAHDFMLAMLNHDYVTKEIRALGILLSED
jgi:hypothetical protein